MDVMLYDGYMYGVEIGCIFIPKMFSSHGRMIF